MIKLKKKKSGDILIDLPMKPVWDNIANLRTFIENFARIKYGEKCEVYDISFTVSELLENAFKFSDGCDVRIIISIKSGDKIGIAIENRSREADIVMLKNEISQIRSASAGKVYERKLNAARKNLTGAGGLGLTMIREKTRGDYELIVKEKNVRLKYSFKIK